MSIVITSTDTPETDRAASRDYSPLSVPYDFARNLERQRNAALSIIEESIDALDGEINIDWRNESRELLRKLGEHLEVASNKARLRQERDDALAALEREQMRLVACDVIAMCDTPESAAKARKMHSDYESAALESVKRRVDECIALRQMVRELRDALQMVNCIDLSPCNGGSCMVATDADDSLDCIKGKATQLITKANQLLP